MSYTGTERRQHRLFVTANTEYHLRGPRCVGVRDLRTGRWVEDHRALGADLIGALTYRAASGWVPTRSRAPQLGEKLCFSSDVLTSAVRHIARPPRQTLENYAVV